jgi:hypothetical protein
MKMNEITTKKKKKKQDFPDSIANEVLSRRRFKFIKSLGSLNVTLGSRRQPKRLNRQVGGVFVVV